MTSFTLQKTALIPLAFAVGFFCGWPGAARAADLPQQPSEYTVKAACAQPAFGHAGCLALRLVRRSSSLSGASAARAGASASSASPQPAPSPALGEVGYTPEQLHSAYELPAEAPSSQTIALVDAYNDPTAAEDLASYSSEFGLPPCGGGCFTQYNQEGKTTSLPFPKTTAELELWRTSANKAKKEEAARAEGWGLEISLDIETAHAICHNCDIALVEAKSTSYADLEAAERAAAGLGATEISNSWGGAECIEAPARECVTSTQAFNHPGIVITASAGDDGYLSWTAPNSAERGFASFPASSPDVIAVGGTRLLLNEAGGWAHETVWNDGGEEEVAPGSRAPDGHGASGGGCSVVFTAQPWQQNATDWSSVGCGAHRAVADVSADADPYTGVAVRYSRPTECESEGLPDWCTIGGTSLASPIVASTFALAGGAATVKYPAQTLYQNQKLRPTSLHDIDASATSGSNGRCSLPFNEEDPPFLTGCTPQQEAATSCSNQLICLAHSGYDGPAGVGTPHGIAAFKALSEQEIDELSTIETEESGRAAAKVAEESDQAKAIAQAEASKRAEEQRKLEEAQRQGAESSLLQGSSPTGTQPAATATTPASVRISALALTFKTLLALNTRRPKLSQVGFAFTSSAATPLRVTLARRVRVRGRTRWQVQHTYRLTAVRGANRKHLSGAGVLVPGEYRVTLTPPGASAASLIFKLG